MIVRALYVAEASFAMIVSRLPKNIPCRYCFVEHKKMDNILTELNLEMLAAVFRREIIVPSIVQWMSNEKIEPQSLCNCNWKSSSIA